jgi:CRISPR/Cas system-associated exonuclease Cas4 (RecB family)
LTKPTVKPVEPADEANLMVIDRPDQEPAYDWMNPIRMFLENQPPSDDNTEVECIACKAKMYHLIDGVLYQ